MDRHYCRTRSRLPNAHRYHFLNEESLHISQSRDSLEGRGSQYASDSNVSFQRNNYWQRNNNTPYMQQYNGRYHLDLRPRSMHSPRERYENFYEDHWGSNSESFAVPFRSPPPVPVRRKYIKHNKQAICRSPVENGSHITGKESCSVREKNPKKSEFLVKPRSNEKHISGVTTFLNTDSRINGRTRKKPASSGITPSVTDKRTEFRAKKRHVSADSAQLITGNRTEFGIKRKPLLANTVNQRIEVQTRKMRVITDQLVCADKNKFKTKQKLKKAQSLTYDSTEISKKKTNAQAQTATSTCSDEKAIPTVSLKQSLCFKAVSSEFISNDKKSEKNHLVQSDAPNLPSKEITPQHQSTSVRTLKIYDNGVIRRIANDTCCSKDKAKVNLLVQKRLKKSLRPKMTLSELNGEVPSDPMNGTINCTKKSGSDIQQGSTNHTLQTSTTVVDNTELNDTRDSIINQREQVISSSPHTSISSVELVRSSVGVINTSSTCPNAADGHTEFVQEKLKNDSSVLSQEVQSSQNVSEISHMSDCTVKVEVINNADADIDPAFSLMDLLVNGNIKSEDDFSDPAIDAIKHLDISMLNLPNCSTDNNLSPCDIVELCSSVSSSTDTENVEELQCSDASVGIQTNESLNLINKLQELTKQEDHLRNETKVIEEAMDDLLSKVDELKIKLDQLKKEQEEIQQTRRQLLLQVEEFLHSSVRSVSSPHIAQTSVPSVSRQVSVVLEHENVHADHVHNKRKSYVEGSAHVGQETNKLKAVSSVLPDSPSEAFVSNANVSCLQSSLPLDVKIHNVQHRKVHNTSISCIETYGDFVFIGGDDGTTIRIKLDDEADVIRYVGHTLGVTNLYINEQSLYTTGHDGHLLQFILKSGNLYHSTGLRGPILSMCEGWQNLYIGLRSGEVIVFSIVKNAQVDAIKCSEKAVSSVATTSQGSQRLLCIASHDSFVTVWDATSKLLLRCLDINIPPSISIQMKVLHNFVYINSPSYSSRSIYVYEPLSGELMQAVNLQSHASSFFVMDDWLVATSVDGIIRFFRNNLNVWSFYAELKRAESSVAVTCMSGNSSLIVTADVIGAIETFGLEIKETTNSCE